MLSVVEYIHYHSIVHQDIKCQNFVINSMDHIKLCDFSSAKHFQPLNSMFLEKTGSAGYHAPEILKGEPYNPKFVDIWDMGVILFSMLTSKFPFSRGYEQELPFETDITGYASSSTSTRLFQQRGTTSADADEGIRGAATNKTLSKKKMDVAVGHPEGVASGSTSRTGAPIDSRSIPSSNILLQLQQMSKGPNFAALQSVNRGRAAKGLLTRILQSVVSDRYTINRTKHTDWYKQENDTAFIGHMARQPQKISAGHPEMELKQKWDV